MNVVFQIFPRTDRNSPPEVGDGAKPDVPTTDRQNEKIKHLVFYEASALKKKLIALAKISKSVYTKMYLYKEKQGIV